MSDELMIGAGQFRARVRRRGAELAQLQWTGLDLLWTPDPAVWFETCPLLFPVIGRVRNDSIRIAGRTYPMPMHGFAAGRSFEITSAQGGSCALELSDDVKTRQHYPYRFRLRMEFSLDPDGLTIGTVIANPGTEPLPASFGLHPGFCWPLVPGTAKQDYALWFPDDEHLVYTRPVDRFVGPSRSTLALTRGELPLTEELFRQGGLLFLEPQSRAVSYGLKGGPKITLAYPDFPQLLLWMRPGSPFLCIEPCRGHADPVDFDGDFASKPGGMLIAPGQEVRLFAQISIAPD